MPHILLVDDEQDHLTVLAVLLRRLPAEVTCARLGREALQAARTQAFHLAVVDLRLPDMDGLTVLAQLLELQPGLPVVMLTAYPSPSSEAEARRRGAVAYLEKPFPPAQLQALLQSLLAGKATRELPRPAKPSTAEAAYL